MDKTEVIKFAQENKVEIVDLKFCDLPGLWQHFSIPISGFSEDLFEEGIGYDGSSIRGFQKIEESDMLLFPDPDSTFLDPFDLTFFFRDAVIKNIGRRSQFNVAIESSHLLFS